MMRLSENLRTVTNADGGVVLDVHQGKMFRLNTTAATILELLARGCTEDRIVAEISQHCDVSNADASADVHTFLATLKNHNLLDEDDQR
jgi:predicted flavoprotein YhiN